jgi:subtilisin family serine protease
MLRRHSPLLIPLLLLAACTDRDLIGPDGETSMPRAAIYRSSTPPFYFLPPLVADPGPFTGIFDGERLPTARVTCTGAEGAECPVVVSFQAAGNSPTIKVDLAEQSYNALWNVPSSLALGKDNYRLEVHDGATLLGSADLWIVASKQELKAVTGDYAGVVRGSPVQLKFRIEKPQLSGNPDDPAGPAIPALRFISNPDDFSRDHPQLPGMAVSYNTIALVLAPAATVGDLDALLTSLGAAIVGGIPGTASAPGILALRLPTTTHEELAAVLEQLREQPLVVAAVPDLEAGTDVTTKEDPGLPDSAWEVQPYGGNWGMEASRAPQLWNFNNAVRKSGRRATTGVVEVYNITDHLDLPALTNLTDPNLPAHDHSMHVTGIISAVHDNGVGVAGANPFADVVFVGVGESALEQFWRMHMLISTFPDVAVVNYSAGIIWPKDTDFSIGGVASEFANSMGRIAWDLFALLEATGVPLPVVVASAGNDSDMDTRFNSAFTNAAIVWGLAPVITVEAGQLDASTGTMSHAPFASTPGDLAAPGHLILSTVGGNGYRLDSGSSMAAPHVAGVVGYLYALAPSLGRPTLTSNPMRDLLVNNARRYPTVRGLDAFAAALALDNAVGGDAVLRALLDIDDGTLHGNHRRGRSPVDVLEDLQTDDRPFNNEVDMRDFRRWRDWLLQVEQPAGLVLDGSETHPKKDLNGDGVVGAPWEENIFPRGDFNGDGIISRTATAVVPALGTQPLTDLQVFQRLFHDPHPMYTAGQLPFLIDSGDLGVSMEECFLIPEVASAQSSLGVGSGATAPAIQIGEFSHSIEAPRGIYTAIAPALYRARAIVRNSAGEVLGGDEHVVGMELGAFKGWIPRCGLLHLTLEMPQNIAVGSGWVPIVATASVLDLLDGSVTPQVWVPITFTSATGELEFSRWVTDFDGRLTNWVLAPESGSGEIVVRISSTWGGQVRRESASASYQ